MQIPEQTKLDGQEESPLGFPGHLGQACRPVLLCARRAAMRLVMLSLLQGLGLMDVDQDMYVCVQHLQRSGIVVVDMQCYNDTVSTRLFPDLFACFPSAGTNVAYRVAR